MPKRSLHHGEEPRPEGGRQLHGDLAAFAQGVVQALRFRLVVGVDGELNVAAHGSYIWPNPVLRMGVEGVVRSVLFLAFFPSASILFPQDCTCKDMFRHTVKYYEDNNPAFQAIKNDRSAFDIYRKGSEEIEREAGNETDIDHCIIHLERYVQLLKDHHSGIEFAFKRTVDISTPAAIAAFKASEAYRKFEKVPLDTAGLVPDLGRKEVPDVEGLYSDGGNILLAVYRKSDTANGYLGVMARQNGLLDVGHVLLELTERPDHSFDAVYNTGLFGLNIQRVFKNIHIENGRMPDLGFSKVFDERTSERPYAFRTIDDSTGYLRLGSFDEAYTDELNAFYDSVGTAIESRPYLIIDIRNNGGGNDGSYFNLVPYAYTRPLQVDPADVWVSPDNIRAYEALGDPARQGLIGRMKAAAPFTFIPYGEGSDNTWSMDGATRFPRRIALLYDNGTASAGEGMITYMLQSDKVITIGENSGGYIGYGNVMTAEVPCGNFTLRSTTTRYKDRYRYEFVGIPPMYKPVPGQDWIAYAIKLLKEGE